MVFLAGSPGVFLRTRIHSSEILVSVMSNNVGCFGVAVAVLKLSVCLLFVGGPKLKSLVLSVHNGWNAHSLSLELIKKICELGTAVLIWKF